MKRSWKREREKKRGKVNRDYFSRYYSRLKGANQGVKLL